MIFNKQYNAILNEMFKNSADAREIFVYYVSKLPDELLHVIRKGKSFNYDDGIFFAFGSFFEGNVAITIRNQTYGEFRISLHPLSSDAMLKPAKQDPDLWFSGEFDGTDTAEGFFSIMAIPTDEGSVYQAQHSGYCSFQLAEEDDGYYLIGDNPDNYSYTRTKIDINDFILKGGKRKTIKSA